MGWHLDGRVSAVVGTHTHIQTADERILPKGTAAITDVGMTGPYDSVIGVQKQIILDRYIYRKHAKFEPAEHDPYLCGVVVDIDDTNGKATKIERLRIPRFPSV
jgi:calcineurin-like phosphoesterase